MQGRAVSRAELAIHARRETKIKEHLLDLPIDHLFAVRVFFYSFQIHEFVNNNDDGNGVNTDYTGRHGWLGSRVVSVLDSGAEGPGFKSQPRRCRVTVLGKLFTPIVPLFTKQQNW